MPIKRTTAPANAPPRCTYGNHPSPHVIEHVDTKQTVCANCFLDIARSWIDVIEPAIAAASVVVATEQTAARRKKKGKA
jgi:hypothetical protein